VAINSVLSVTKKHECCVCVSFLFQGRVLGAVLMTRHGALLGTSGFSKVVYVLMVVVVVASHASSKIAQPTCLVW